MTFDIVSRMNTRSTSYTKRSVVAVLEKLELKYVQKGVILTVEVPQESRRELERQLQLIDHNVYYKVNL